MGKSESISIEKEGLGTFWVKGNHTYKKTWRQHFVESMYSSSKVSGYDEILFLKIGMNVPLLISIIRNRDIYTFQRS